METSTPNQVSNQHYFDALACAERELEELRLKCLEMQEIERRTRIVAFAMRQLRSFLELEPSDLSWVDPFLYRKRKPKPERAK